MAAPTAALEGVRVLDLGRYQAGPRCGLVLQRLGAEVIKVEKPGGEEGRQNPPFVRGQSAYWVQYNSGKKSITLNLRDDQAKELLRGLVSVSDILHSELPARRHSGDGLRVRRAEGTEPADHHGQRLRLRPVRPLR